MNCPLIATAQDSSQFRKPEIPALRSLSGKLISAPTRPQTTLRSLVPEEQQSGAYSSELSELSEYQFPETSAGEFRELSNQNSLRGTSLPYGAQGPQGAQLGTELTPWESNGNTIGPGVGQVIGDDQSAESDFDGFTPRSFNSNQSLEAQGSGGSNFDTWNFESAVEQSLRNSSQDEYSEDSMEQLPPAIDEVRPDNDPRANTITQRFPNGNKRIVRTVAQDEDGNFSNHGPWEAFDIKGKSVAAGVFKRGVMQGQWRRIHTQSEGGLFSTQPFTLFQGPYLSVANFKDGKLNGLWTIYDRFRSKIFEIRYEKGIRNGTATWWYPNRAKMREATFKDGLLDGMILGWDDAEKPTRREEYVMGRRIVRNVTFYRPKMPKQEEFFLDSKLEPEGEDNWWDAQPASYLPRGSKVKNGGTAQWYQNGQLKHQGQFKEGQPVGRFIWWHANGNKHIQGIYTDGKKNRTWTWWHKNGIKKTEGTYQDDQPVGIWRAWHSDGNLRNEESFSLDQNDSESDTFDSGDDQGSFERPNTDNGIDGEDDGARQSGQSVIDLGDDFEMPAIEELPEEIPETLPDPNDQPIEQPDPEQESESAEIEGYDFNKQKTVDSDSFREPAHPQTLDPFGEYELQSDGSIPDTHFKQAPEFDDAQESLPAPQSNFFRAPTIPENSPESGGEGQPVSEPYNRGLFQTPRLEDLTTMKEKNSETTLNR